MMENELAAITQRLTEIEIRMAYQEQGQETLHEVVLEQTNRIETLERQIETLRRRIEAGTDEAALPGDPSQEPPPPHY